jgi:2-polyprenyl-6-methoxyphenol hydroxylase-like FAD-dependent oxidoreductase
MGAVRRVLIQGGGIGGLALATALGQRGVETDVLEATAPDAVLGVGLNQPANALAALAEIGVRDQCLEVGFPWESLGMWNAGGVQVAAIPPPADSRYGRPSNNAISRPLYNGILRTAAEKAGATIRTGVTAWDLHERDDGVEVEVATWTGKHTPPTRDPAAVTRRYDLVVGFDGIRSTVRAHLFGETYAPRFTGYANWRVTIARPAHVDHIVMAMGDGVKAVLTPISEERMYFGLVTPEPGNPRHDPADLLELFRERTRGFSGRLGELRDSVSPADRIVYTPLEDVTVREPWHRGRIAIAGDAAHASAPTLAQGAAMAVEDAVALAAALDDHDDVEPALDAWFRRRRERALFVADFSLGLLKQENGEQLTPAESDLLAVGVPGAQARLAREAY